MATKKELETYKIRCAEAEKALEDCNAAFELIPVRSLEKGQIWMPSDVALLIIRKAKNSIINYTNLHWHNGNDR